MAQPDPYRNFRFRVEFDQVQHGGFTRVKGLLRETKYESYREGGVNDHEHKLATMTNPVSNVNRVGYAPRINETNRFMAAPGVVCR